eukprot:TRINITY_DN1821_c0_g1_i1.p1 TRINITY_DN1821_c0_g1~~TRINITY_DN1821_c0_g1_i1.p1  ORF type:complete len:777 (-),score=20.93 TRINITY_DN1821_c0_g1_i1:198-2201(-)
MKARLIPWSSSAKGETPIYGSCTPEEYEAEMKSLKERGINSFLDIFEENCKKYPDQPLVTAIKGSERNSKTFREIQGIGQALAKGIVELGYNEPCIIEGKPWHTLGCCGEFCWEIFAVDVAALYLSAATVFVQLDMEGKYKSAFNGGYFDTLITTPAYLPKILEKIEEQVIIRVPSTIILTRAPDPKDRLKATSIGIHLQMLDAVLEKGRQSTIELPRPTFETPLWFIWTSGTTEGIPKCVVILHKSIAYKFGFRFGFYVDHIKPGYVTGGLYTIGTIGSCYSRSVCIARVVNFNVYEERLPTLFDEFHGYDPDYVFSNPIIVELFNSEIKKRISVLPISQQKFINATIEKKLVQLKKNGTFTDKVLDKELQPLKESVAGKKLKFIYLGGAVPRREVLDYVSCVLSVPICNSYGSSEIGGGLTFGLLDEGYETSSLFPTYRIKLVECDTASDDSDSKSGLTGKLMVLGPTFHCYLGDPEKTKNAYSDGWYETCDLVTITKDGKFKWSGRADERRRTVYEQYILPTKLEVMYSASPYVSQIALEIRPCYMHIMAVVHPKKEAALDFAKSKGLDLSYEELCHNKEFEAEVLEDLKAIAKRQKLLPIEFVRAVHLVPETLFNFKGVLSDLGKVNRGMLSQTFDKEFGELSKKAPHPLQVLFILLHSLNTY